MKREVNEIKIIKQEDNNDNKNNDNNNNNQVIVNIKIINKNIKNKITEYKA